MNLTALKSMGFTVLSAAALVAGAPAYAQQVQPTDAGLAADTLADGENLRAIALLKAELELYPEDPALLINLGIAQARRGDNAEARQSFDAAMASNEVIELETANGSTTDSRRLARRAIAMLDRGEFRPAPRNAGQLTLRD